MPSAAAVGHAPNISVSASQSAEGLQTDAARLPALPLQAEGPPMGPWTFRCLGVLIFTLGVKMPTTPPLRHLEHSERSCSHSASACTVPTGCQALGPGDDQHRPRSPRS